MNEPRLDLSPKAAVFPFSTRLLRRGTYHPSAERLYNMRVSPTYPVAVLNGSQFWPGERSVLCSNEGLWVGAGYQIRSLEFSHSPFCREGRRARNGVDAGSCLGEEASIKSPMYGSGELLRWWTHGGSGLMAHGEGMNALLLPTHLVLHISSIRVFIGLLYHIAL